MTTELWINNRRIAVLNESLSRRKPGSEIRVSIPDGIIQSGENTWEIRQTPLALDDLTFDECKIGPVSLETEPIDASR